MFWWENTKTTKWSHFYKGYASTYNVSILNSFNPELQLQNSESVIENNIFLWTTRFIDWIERLKFEFKFGITLVLELKSIESDNETKYSTFH